LEAGRLVSKFLSGMEPGAPSTLAHAVLVLAAVAAAAALVPARRAAKLDPTVGMWNFAIAIFPPCCSIARIVASISSTDIVHSYRSSPSPSPVRAASGAPRARPDSREFPHAIRMWGEVDMRTLYLRDAATDSDACAPHRWLDFCVIPS
jgi:hypothetical protein